MKITFWPFRTMKQELVHLKDPTPENQRNRVVYKVPYVVSVHGNTLSKLAGYKTIAWESTNRHSRTGMCQRQHLLNTSAAGHQVDLSKATLTDLKQYCRKLTYFFTITFPLKMHSHTNILISTYKHCIYPVALIPTHTGASVYTRVHVHIYLSCR